MSNDLGLKYNNNKVTCVSVMERVTFYFVKSFWIYL
jgi:hypothetical protein